MSNENFKIILDEISKYRDNLLDSSRRNKFINFNPSKNKSIKIIDENILNLFDILVLNEKKMNFLPIEALSEEYPDKEDLSNLNNNLFDVSDNNKRHTDLSLQTNEQSNTLSKKLTKLLKDNTSTIEEKGFNSLFIALAFLEWKDVSYQNSISKAPLILIPVKLERIYDRFYVSWNYEEIKYNLTLKYIFEDMNVDFPTFESLNSKEELKEYLKNIETAIKDKEDWKINDNIYFSLFSFKKLAMYQDLELSNWKNLKDNNIKKLYFNESDNTSEVLDYTDSYSSKEMYNVLDADSSQLEVIQNIKNDVDLVVEGPPGTGKSQTIVNIIAELIASGKSVLFVSEKKVALDVVKKRLDNVNLGDACLELHGDNHNKKAFIQELSRTLSLKPSKIEYGNTYIHLDIIKKDVTTYSNSIYHKFGDTNIKPYEFIGLLDKYDKLFENCEQEIIDIKIDNVETISPIVYDEILDNLSKLSQQYDLVKPVQENYWNITDINELNISEIDEIRELLNDAVDNSNKLYDIINNILYLVGANNNNNKLYDLFKNLYVLNPNLLNVEYYEQMLNLVQLLKKYQSLSSGFIENNNFQEIKNHAEQIIGQISASPFKEGISSSDLNDKLSNLKSLHEAIMKSYLKRLTSDKHLHEKMILFGKYKDIPLAYLINNEYNELRHYLQSLYPIPVNDEEIYRDLVNLSKNYNNYADLRSEIESYCDISLSYDQLFVEYDNLTYYENELNQIKDYLHCNNVTNDVLLNYLDRLIESQRIKDIIIRQDELGKDLFGTQWLGIKSDINALEMKIHQFDNFKQLYDNGFYTQKTIEFIKTNTFSNYDELVNQAILIKENLDNSREKLNHLLNMENFEKSDALTLYELKCETDKYNELLDHFASLNDFRIFESYCKEFTNEYTYDIISIINEDKIKSEYIKDIFKYNFIKQSLKKIFYNDTLNKFNYKVHNNRIEEFKEYDLKSITLNQNRVREKFLSRLPDINTNLHRYSDLGLLNKEISKKSKHLPIRKILANTTGIITKIKPCFMMSPMSIAQYLDPAKYESFFDYVIFDEASQVKIEDSLGALLRGKHYIIMGDTKQLPPTIFFDSSVEIDDDEDEIFSTIGIESILEHAKVTFNTKMLKWHYRSKHDSLIAVSNNEFYNNELYVFPSCHKSSEDLGLKLIYNPNTIYDKGKSATNKLEALNIIEYLFELLDKYSHSKTIGIATFNKRQRDLLEDLLHKKLQENNRHESYFNEKENNFFIKNLENIQGDEKDIIIISMGYGYDRNHKISMNFGPLNQDGGERRLNVLITRAKEQCIVFSNFKSQDLRVDKNSANGLQSLKTFLYYAEKGEFPRYIQTGADFDSEFEKSVYDILTSHGYKIDKQVGTAGYKIDLAVVNPTNPDDYILAIECDGASYHSSKSARDRDRLRQQVLENLGWKFYRIWSTDWYHNRSDAIKRLLEKVEEEINKYTEE